MSGSGAHGGWAVQLTEVKALVGMVDERRTIMGIIRQLEDDRFFIQDESGSVPVDLSEAGTIAGFFVGGGPAPLWTGHIARMPASSAPCPAAPLRGHWPCIQKASGLVWKGCLSHRRTDGHQPLFLGL